MPSILLLAQVHDAWKHGHIPVRNLRDALMACYPAIPVFEQFEVPSCTLYHAVNRKRDLALICMVHGTWCSDLLSFLLLAWSLAGQVRVQRPATLVWLPHEPSLVVPFRQGR